jgi:hypothetical protein
MIKIEKVAPDMIKVFTLNNSGYAKDGDDLTKQFEEWTTSLPKRIEIVAMHTNSNKYSYMLTIHYKILG